MDEAVRVLRDQGAIVEDVDLPRHLGLSHLRARHHHRRGARHPSPGGDRDAGEVRLHDAPPLPARRLPDRRAVSLGRALPPQAAGRHARGHARLRPGDDAPTSGARRRPSRNRSRSSTSSARPRSACRSTSPASRRSPCAAASAATASARLPARRPAVRRGQRLRRRRRLRTRHAVAPAPPTL